MSRPCCGHAYPRDICTSDDQVRRAADVYDDSTDACNRSLINEQDWVAVGTKTRTTIYNGVGNPEVGQMMGSFFPEVCESLPSISLQEINAKR